MPNYSQYWFEKDNGFLSSGNYSYHVEQNIITDKWRIIFKGRRQWNQQVRKVRYYTNTPTNKNICLTVRSL